MSTKGIGFGEGKEGEEGEEICSVTVVLTRRVILEGIVRIHTRSCLMQCENNPLTLGSISFNRSDDDADDDG